MFLYKYYSLRTNHNKSQKQFQSFQGSYWTTKQKLSINSANWEKLNYVATIILYLKSDRTKTLWWISFQKQSSICKLLDINLQVSQRWSFQNFIKPPCYPHLPKIINLINFICYLHLLYVMYRLYRKCIDKLFFSMINTYLC